MDMDNINDIIANLSSDDIDMLKGVASSILGEEAQKSQQRQEQNHFKESSQKNQTNLPANLGFENIDFDMVMKAKKIFDRMNSTQNKNVDLIMALKPHLSPEKQDRADQALRILKLFEVLPLLKELF